MFRSMIHFGSEWGPCLSTWIYSCSSSVCWEEISFLYQVAWSINDIKFKIFKLYLIYVKVKVTQSCLTLWDSVNCSLSGSFVHEDSLGQNTAWVALPFSRRDQTQVPSNPTQGSNPGLQCCRQILYHLSHQGSPWYTRGPDKYICRVS